MGGNVCVAGRGGGGECRCRRRSTILIRHWFWQIHLDSEVDSLHSLSACKQSFLCP